MKKLVKVFALAALMIMGGQAMAQTRGAMFLSGAFPLKDYADFDGFDDFALTSFDLDADDGGAGIGFNVGLKWYFNVGVKGLGVMLSVDGIYNGPNGDLKTAYRNAESQAGNQWVGGSFTYNSTPKYINVPAMLGLNYIYHFNPNLGIYVEAGAGGNLRFITAMETVGKGNIGNIESQVTTTQKYDNAFSFAYQVGAGFEVAKNLVVGVSFYDLGKAQVKGDQIVKTKSIINNETTTNNNYNTYGTIRPVMIMGRIGFSF